MTAIFYHFTDEILNSAAFETWKQNMLDGEMLVYPCKQGGLPSKPAVLISDIREALEKWSKDGGIAIGYEHDSVRLPVSEIVTDLEELYPEDLSDIIAYATEQSILSFFSGDFDFYRLGFTDYRHFYELQSNEPFLLPESYKNLNEEELQLRYQRDIARGRMHPLYTVYGYTESGSDELIGQVAIEPSLLSEQAANLSYYIIPGKRGQGIATKAVQAFLKAKSYELGDTPLLAVINRSNKASVRLAKRCGFAVLSKNQKLLEKLPEGFFTMLYDNSPDA